MMTNGPSSSKKSKPGKKVPLTPAQVLQRIRPAKLPSRFLIAWDPARKELWFGCGGVGGAVQISSGRRLRIAEVDASVRSTKLRRETVQDFRAKRTKINGPGLFRTLQAQLQKYLHFEDARLYSLLSVWTVGTYLFPSFSHYGYLFLHSKFPRSAKSRVLEVLSHLAFEATVPLNSPTVPTIRDTAADGCTMQLDTLERWKGKGTEAFSALMEYLDAGFRNGGTVAKKVPLGDGNWQTQFFNVFAPYTMAAIDKDSLSDTALDRSFVIEMKRKTIRVKVKAYNNHLCEKESLPLRNDLYLLALQNARAISRIYESPQLEKDVAALLLHDRAVDIWKPLLAIAHSLGGTAWQELAPLATEMGRDEQSAEEAHSLEIIRALRAKAEADGGEVTGMTSTLLDHLISIGIFPENAKDTNLYEVLLRGALEKGGFEQKSIRVPDPRRGWELSATALSDLEQQLMSGSGATG